MRVRVTTIIALGTIALSVSAISLGLPVHFTAEHHTSSPRTGKPTTAAQTTAVLPSTVLEPLLLDEDDLGSGYLRKPQRPSRHDDVTVVGCPALSELGGDATTGGTLTFPHKAKTAFTYGGSSSEITEELYSDAANVLSDGIGRIFDAMTGCPTYQVIAGGAVIDVASQKLSAPHELGDEQWSQLLTVSAGGRSTVIKQTAIRDGGLLLIVSGSPALVDRHLDKALVKATSTS